MSRRNRKISFRKHNEEKNNLPLEEYGRMLGFQTGDNVKADIPRGKFAGRYMGRITIRQSPSFGLNGFDTHPKCLKRIHRSDGFEYQRQINNDLRANAKQKRSIGNSISLA